MGAVQAIQSLTYFAFERPSRTGLFHRLIAGTFSSNADERSGLSLSVFKLLATRVWSWRPLGLLMCALWVPMLWRE